MEPGRAAGGGWVDSWATPRHEPPPRLKHGRRAPPRSAGVAPRLAMPHVSALMALQCGSRALPRLTAHQLGWRSKLLGPAGLART